MDPFDLFGSLFGGGGRGRGRQERNQTQDVVHELGATIKDLYCGKTKKLAINRKVLCGSCQGSGSTKPGMKAECGQCSGQGVEIKLRQIGPGFVQQVQVKCSRCSGTGKYIEAKYQCKGCKGNGLTRKKETIEVHIEKGMMDGSRLTFHGMADEELGKTTGDVVIVLDERCVYHIATVVRLTWVLIKTGACVLCPAFCPAFTRLLIKTGVPCVLCPAFCPAFTRCIVSPAAVYLTCISLCVDLGPLPCPRYVSSHYLTTAISRCVPRTIIACLVCGNQ